MTGPDLTDPDAVQARAGELAGSVARGDVDTTDAPSLALASIALSLHAAGLRQQAASDLTAGVRKLADGWKLAADLLADDTEDEADETEQTTVSILREHAHQLRALLPKGATS